MSQPRKQGAERRSLARWGDGVLQLSGVLHVSGRRLSVVYVVLPEDAGTSLQDVFAEETLYRRLAWQQRLLAAVRPQDLLEALIDLGLQDRDLVRACSRSSLSTRTLRRWRREGFPESKADERWEALDDLRAIIGFMLAEGTYDDEEGIVSWLRSRQPDLNLQRPLDVLGEGRFDEVLRSAERASGPAPGEGPITLARDPEVAEGTSGGSPDLHSTW